MKATFRKSFVKDLKRFDKDKIYFIAELPNPPRRMALRIKPLKSCLNLTCSDGRALRTRNNTMRFTDIYTKMVKGTELLCF